MSKLREGIEKIKEKADTLREDLSSSRNDLRGLRLRPLQKVLHRRLGRLRQAIGDEGPLREIKNRIRRNISRARD